MTLKDYIKAPGDRLDYGIDWRDRLEPGETIVSSPWAINSLGLTKLSSYIASGRSVIWIEGGTVGAYYVLQNVITTNKVDPVSGQPRVFTGSIGIFVREK